MFQVIFNQISAAEISKLPTMEQLGLLNEFQVTPADLENLDGSRFGNVKRDGKSLYRYRADDYRIYFAIENGNVIVHRLLHKDTFEDFLFRTNLGAHNAEDEALGKSAKFWELIAEGEKAKRA